VRDELQTDSIDGDACDAADSAAGAETAAAAAEPPKYIKGRLKDKLALLEPLLHISMGALMDHKWVTDSLERDGSATSSCLCQSTGSSEAP
jgi:hypothetical protein